MREEEKFSVVYLYLSVFVSLSLSLSLPLLLFSTVVKECHKLSPVIGFIETFPSLCLLVDLISFLHFFSFFSFVSRRCASLPSAVCRLCGFSKRFNSFLEIIDLHTFCRSPYWNI